MKKRTEPCDTGSELGSEGGEYPSDNTPRRNERRFMRYLHEGGASHLCIAAQCQLNVDDTVAMHMHPMNRRSVVGVEVVLWPDIVGPWLG